jgi:hypothetical protein
MISNKEKAVAVACGLLAAVFISFVMNSIVKVLDQPDVHYSNSTGECVRVLNYTEDDAIEMYSCDNLPSMYRKVWVK